jgi:hypothetical protein
MAFFKKKETSIQKIIFRWFHIFPLILWIFGHTNNLPNHVCQFEPMVLQKF